MSGPLDLGTSYWDLIQRRAAATPERHFVAAEQLEIVTALPRNPAGKIVEHELRADLGLDG